MDRNTVSGQTLKVYCQKCGRLLVKGRFERTNPQYNSVTGEPLPPEGSWELRCPIFWHNNERNTVPLEYRIYTDGVVTERYIIFTQYHGYSD